MSDDRIRNSRATEDRSRVAATEVLSSSAERKKMFREFIQEALPTPPKKDGWHYVWLSSTNQYDPIYKRMRMGYEAVKAEELPGYENYRVKSGEFEGLISVNEMVLFKIPVEFYQEIMEEYHYNMPLEEEERLKSNAQGSEVDSRGKRLGEFDRDDEGFKSLHQVPRNKPVFN